MGRKFFDRFMVDNENGRNLKLMRLSDAEFRALVQGVWPIASKADARGAFMVGKAPATAEDICNQSPKTTRRTAESLLKKMRDVGMLEYDDELGAEWVHDWDKLNPSPKADRTNAERQARFRARNADRNGVTNANGNEPVTPPEVEGRKEKTPPTPRSGGAERAVRFNSKPVPPAIVECATRILNAFNQQAGTSYRALDDKGQPTENFKRILGAVTADGRINSTIAERMIALAFRDPYWGASTPHPGNVFGPRVYERYLIQASATRADDAELRRKLLGDDDEERAA